MACGDSIGHAWGGKLAARLSRAIAAVYPAPWGDDHDQHHQHHQHHNDDRYAHVWAATHAATADISRFCLRCALCRRQWHRVCREKRRALWPLYRPRPDDNDHGADDSLRYTQLPDDMRRDQRREMGEVQRGRRWNVPRQRQFRLLRWLSWQSLYAIVLSALVINARVGAILFLMLSTTAFTCHHVPNHEQYGTFGRPMH